MTAMSADSCQAFGAAFASLRSDYGHTPWDARGTATILWQRRDQDAAATVRAMAKAASDRNNDTPASVNFTSSQGSLRNACGTHPLSAIRDDGQCAGCWSDQRAADQPLPLSPKSSRTEADRQRIRQIAGIEGAQR